MVYRMRSSQCWRSCIQTFSLSLRSVVRTSGLSKLLESSKATTLLQLFLSYSSTLWESPYHPSENGLESNPQWSSTTIKITQMRPAMATVPLMDWDKEIRFHSSSPITSTIRFSSLYLDATRRRPPNSSSRNSVGLGSRSTPVLYLLVKHQRQRLCLSPDRTEVTRSTAISLGIWSLILTWNPTTRRALTSASWNVSST